MSSWTSAYVVSPESFFLVVLDAGLAMDANPGPGCSFFFLPPPGLTRANDVLLGNG